MASTMRNLARGLSGPQAVEERQENSVEQVQHKPHPDPTSAPGTTTVESLPAVEESKIPDPKIVKEVPSTVVLEAPTLESAAVPELEPSQPELEPEKKTKPKPPPKKPKAADQKKVNTPKVETDT